MTPTLTVLACIAIALNVAMIIVMIIVPIWAMCRREKPVPGRIYSDEVNRLLELDKDQLIC